MTFNPQDHLIRIRDKDYLPVVWRIRWFREDARDGTIVTRLIEHNLEHKFALFEATVDDRKGIATGYGSETGADWRDYVEKAETKAVGRALAMLGYGTAFTDEFDELARIVDSPLDTRAKSGIDNNMPKYPAENGLKGLKTRWAKVYRIKTDPHNKWEAFKVNVLGHGVPDSGLDREHMLAILAVIELEEHQIKL